jgi:valyl-tRNA synthetase
LGNSDFMAKAPEAVVDKQRERQRVAREDTERITAKLAGLA